MNSSFWIGAPLSPAPRPPALAPRRRRIDAAVERRLRAWIRSVLRLPALSAIALSEWVAMDSRCVPHTISVVVGRGVTLRHFTIEQASERISEHDVRRALGPHAPVHIPMGA